MAKEEGGRYTPVCEREFHASGHASREESGLGHRSDDPDWIVPIHAEAREWFLDRFEDVGLAEEGVAIEF